MASGAPAAKLKLLVEQQVARSLAILYGQCGESLTFCMKLHHAAEINRADDIHIMQNEGLLKPAGILKEKPGGFFQAPASIQQDLLARDFNAHAEVIVDFQIFEKKIGKVMDVDDYLADPKGAQTAERDLEQRAAGDFHQRLGTTVGERAEARAETGGEDHGFHRGVAIKSARLRRRPLQGQSKGAFIGALSACPDSPTPDGAPPLPRRSGRANASPIAPRDRRSDAGRRCSQRRSSNF